MGVANAQGTMAPQGQMPAPQGQPGRPPKEDGDNEEPDGVDKLHESIDPFKILENAGPEAAFKFLENVSSYLENAIVQKRVEESGK
jgi:hypothetical protein